MVTAAEQLRDVAVCKTVAHRQIRKRGALPENGIRGVEQYGSGHDAAYFHLVQHPGRGDATLGSVEGQDLS